MAVGTVGNIVLPKNAAKYTKPSLQLRNGASVQNTSGPALPQKLALHEDGVSMFKAAQDGVSFTGVVHLPTHTIYLHPLIATRAGNVDMNQMGVAAHNSAGALDGAKATNPVFHPNMTPGDRAMSGQTSGHTKICARYKLSEDECIGFAVAKNAHQNTITTTSRTLNSTKFLELNPDYHNGSDFVKRMINKNAEFQGGYKRSDGQLSMAWTALIAKTLEISFIHSMKNPQGHCEAPF